MIQEMNTDLIELLTPHFQRRSESNFSWSNTVPTFLGAAGVVGLWPMSSIDAANNGDIFDVSGNSRTLTNNNTVEVSNYGLAPYASFTRANSEYLSRPDEAGLDILGTEPYIIDNGLTIVAWIYPTLSGSTQAISGRWSATPDMQLSYLLRLRGSDNKAEFIVAADLAGSSFVSAISSDAITLNRWTYLVGRWTPSTEVSLFNNVTNQFNIEKITNTTSVPATMPNTNSFFGIGGRRSGAGTSDHYSGRISITGLYSSSLSDAIVKNMGHQSFASYGI